MINHITLGSSPTEETCAQVGTNGYFEIARCECKQFIAAIRRTLGPEPAGASLHVCAHRHDFGTYYEVCCLYDDDIELAVEYAYRCESNLPATWSDADRVALGRNEVG